MEAEIRQALQEIPELNDMQDSLMIDYSPDGLRIQILDDENIPMFAAGRAVLNDQWPENVGDHRERYHQDAKSCRCDGTYRQFGRQSSDPQ